MLETLTHATFAPHIGSTFRIHFDPVAAMEVELIEAEPLPTPAPRKGRPAAGRAPFVLLFRGRPQPWYPQRLYRVEHPALGAFELFLVPVGPDQSGMRYEAIFS